MAEDTSKQEQKENTSEQTKKEDTSKQAEKEVVNVHKQVSPNWLSNIEQIRKEALYRERGLDKNIKSAQGSVTAKKDGSIALSSGHTSHIQLSPEGIEAHSSPYGAIKHNTYSIDAYDVIVNNHKLNNKLYELADFKKVLNTYDGSVHIAGGLTMLGTVLVKAWEPNLKRYVLVRRQVNVPMFSPAIGGFEVPPGIKITPQMDIIQKVISDLNTTGLTSYAQLSTALEAKRKQAITAQEAATAKENEATKTANAQKQAISMSTLTGQVASQVGGTSAQYAFNISPSDIAASAQGHGGGGGSFTGDKSVRYDGTANDMAKEAWSEAQRIAKDLNVDPTIIYGQWYHESGGFSSKLAMENCNLGGLTQTTPNGAENKQPDGGNYYMKFGSIHEYAEYFKRIWGPDIKGVSSAEQYASNLKREGYYGDSYNNYVAGIYGGMKYIPSSTT